MDEGEGEGEWEAGEGDTAGGGLDEAGGGLDEVGEGLDEAGGGLDEAGGGLEDEVGGVLVVQPLPGMVAAVSSMPAWQSPGAVCKGKVRGGGGSSSRHGRQKLSQWIGIDYIQ